MAKGKATDKFANIAALLVNETVAGTTAYGKFAFPFSILDKVGLLINRIEYSFSSLNQLDTSTDSVWAALIAANSIADITDITNPLIVDNTRLQRIDLGVAASGFFIQLPYIKDFSSMPGGGILVAPAPLSIAVKSDGAGGVMGVAVKVFYTYMELSTEEYWELVESRRIITD